MHRARLFSSVTDPGQPDLMQAVPLTGPGADIGDPAGGFLVAVTR